MSEKERLRFEGRWVCGGEGVSQWVGGREARARRGKEGGMRLWNTHQTRNKLDQGGLECDWPRFGLHLQILRKNTLAIPFFSPRQRK